MLFITQLFLRYGYILNLFSNECIKFVFDFNDIAVTRYLIDSFIYTMICLVVRHSHARRADLLQSAVYIYIETEKTEINPTIKISRAHVA